MRSHAEWAVAALLTAALIVPVACGTAAAEEASAVPTKLVGRWSRNVTAADVRRVPGSLATPGVYSMTIKRSGVLGIYFPAGAPEFVKPPKGAPNRTGTVSATPDGRMVIVLDCPADKGLYRWKVSGRLLTITLVKEPCTEQAPVFWGVWKRK